MFESIQRAFKKRLDKPNTIGLFDCRRVNHKGNRIVAPRAKFPPGPEIQGTGGDKIQEGGDYRGREGFQ